jgi:hypothetical protein
MSKLIYLHLVFLGLLVGTAAGQDPWFIEAGDWLSTPVYYVNGPYYIGSPYYVLPSDFSEPYYYPYYGNGTYPAYYYPFYDYYGYNIHPTTLGPNAVRTANTPLPYLYPNWGNTLNAARTSSFRVYSNRDWTTI